MPPHILAPKLQRILDRDPDDRVFYASEHPCHYNAWRRNTRSRRYHKDQGNTWQEPLGQINGEPFGGGA